jgi:hypothetical protein
MIMAEAILKNKIAVIPCCVYGVEYGLKDILGSGKSGWAKGMEEIITFKLNV